MKPKAKTILERHGFKDDDLIKPKHDEIMIWLDNKLRSGSLLKNKIELPDESKAIIWDNDRDRKCFRSFDDTISRIKDILMCHNKFYEIATKYNLDIKDGMLYFDKAHSVDDIINTIFKFVPSSIDIMRRRVTKCDIIWEYPLYNDMERKFCIGYIDLYCEIRTIFNTLTDYFEVKTEIKSLGELFRQLNTYRDKLRYEGKLRDGNIYVVCPDDKYKDIIESQGYGFIKYKKEY